MDLFNVHWVTAEELHDRFKQAITRHPVPDIDKCAELAERLNRHLLLLHLVHAGESRSLNDLAEAVRYARHLARVLQRIPWVNRLLDPPPRLPVGEELQAVLARFLEAYPQRWRRRKTKAGLRLACAGLCAPDIVETLRKAGWDKVSTTSAGGPVVAVLALLIGVVTDEEPDRDALSTTLKEELRRTKREGKRARKPSTRRDASRRRFAN